MKRIFLVLLFSLSFLPLTGQSSSSGSNDDLTPEQKYLRTMLNPQGTGAGMTLEYAVTGSARLDYGTMFEDSYEGSQTQGFLTTIDSSLDIAFTFNPDSFAASPRQSFLKKGMYAEIILTDFGVVISDDAGVDFWDNYTIYDNEGNPYLPSQEADAQVIADEDTEDEVEYESTFLATGVSVTEPTVEANIHLNPNVYFQIASKPEIDHNLSTTLGGQGEWAGAATENTGGFSFIMEYPRFLLQSSVVSQYYYSEDDTEQDDEFAGSITASYDLNDYLTLQGYGGFINFYDADNEDSFYFATDRTGSSADAMFVGGAGLTYNILELAEMGLTGDFAYVLGGEYNKGTEDTPDMKDYNGYLYDIRLDLPFPFNAGRGVIAFSIGTYGYSFGDEIFAETERSDEIPLDLQLAFTYTEERWQFQTALQGFNILDRNNEYENYLRDDHQELGVLINGNYTFGNLSALAVTPALSLSYSTGRLMKEGDTWSDVGQPATYVDDWEDDELSLEASVSLAFPQTVISLTYTSVQLLPGQGECSSGDAYTTLDTGVLIVSTVISY